MRKILQKTEIFEYFPPIAVACIGMGLLYLVRGSFLPYFYPLYENLTSFSYSQIALLLNVFILSQAIASPVLGIIIDKIQPKKIAVIGVLCFFLGFVTILFEHSFFLNIFAALFLGIGLMAIKNSLSVDAIRNAQEKFIRKAVAIRSMFINAGSFTGNLCAFGIIAIYGAKLHIIFLISVIVVIGYLILKKMKAGAFIANTAKANFSSKLHAYLATWKNREFVADAILMFAVIMPDGCWGTIIPKYIIDTYHSNHPIVIMYATSLTTFIVCSYMVNSFISAKFQHHKNYISICRGIGLCVFIAGILIYTFSASLLFLCVAVFVFILGEIVTTPCYDEISKKHAGADNAQVGSYFGVLGLFDGLARVVGSAIAFTIYGFLRTTPYRSYLWVSLAIIFVLVSVVLYGIAQWLLSRSRNIKIAETTPLSECISGK